MFLIQLNDVVRITFLGFNAKQNILPIIVMIDYHTCIIRQMQVNT